MKKQILTYLIAPLALWVASCSSDNTIEEVRDITESTDPMRFSNVSANYLTRTDYTIPNLLKQGFMVSCYKKFGQPDQQTVMPQYEVNYEQYDSWYGEKVSWNYISAESSHQFYQEQFVKYWDYSAFPYRFHAVSPAPLSASGLASGFQLTDKVLKVPASIPYVYQTSKDGMTTPGAEPCMVAQVERREDGRDFDLLASNGDAINPGPKEINNGSGTSLNRFVTLPFHHLTAKVRFGIYCPDPEEEGDGHEVKDVKITVRSNDFVTSAQYNANLTTGNLTDGSFVSPTYGDKTLIELTPEATLVNNDLNKANTKETAYMFECPLGLLQIPQNGVKISVSMKIQGKLEDDKWHDNFDGDYTVFEDLPIILNETLQDTYDWEKNHFYTYYIIIGKFINPIPTYPIGGGGDSGIYFTCVETPWDEITGAPIDASLEN